MSEKFFAKLDENNIVLDVHVVNGEVMKDSNGNIREELGLQFLILTHEWPFWKQCCPEHSIRKNYPGRGFSYDPIRDAFIAPKEFPSWVLNETTCRWEPPIGWPELTVDENENTIRYYWDEPSLSWKIHQD